MRTTLDIDEDVLQGAKETAEMKGTTAGRVISDWARRGFFNMNGHSDQKKRIRNGVPLLPSRGKIVTMKLIQEIMDEEGI
ncbi:MAG: hypothetical protein ABIO36_07235 [Pyrinomonadaceae bacterium]